MVNRSSTGLVFALIVAVFLTVLILPQWAQFFRPQWVLLVLIYRALYSDRGDGLVLTWSMGILLDLLSGTLLGLHALGMVIIIYVIVKLQRQLRMFPLWQQAGVVFILNLIYLGILFWVQNIWSTAPGTWLFWMSALTSALIWPWLTTFLSARQQRFKEVL